MWCSAARLPSSPTSAITIIKLPSKDSTWTLPAVRGASDVGHHQYLLCSSYVVPHTCCCNVICNRRSAVNLPRYCDSTLFVLHEERGHVPHSNWRDHVAGHHFCQPNCY